MSEPDHIRRARERARQAKPAERNGTPDECPEDRRGDAWEPPAPQPTGEQLGIYLSTVQPERVEWLWPGRIPLGKLTLLDGDPGLGKSVLTMDLAARVSAGLSMPDGAPSAGAAGVVLLSAEDGLADTIAPRLLAAGADLSRILALPTVSHPARPPAIPGDMVWIKAAVQQTRAALVVVDPLMAFLSPDVNSHRDQDVRRGLLPLAALAGEMGFAVVVVRHLNKAAGGNPLYRGGGSIGIIGAARSGLLVARDPDNPDKRVLASTKCNLAKLPASLSFDLSLGEGGGLRVGWMGESQHTAESLLAIPVDGEEQGAVAEAAEVLRSILSDGPRDTNEVKCEAHKAGVTERTLSRAKTMLGITSRRTGYGANGKWQWFLPQQRP
jgi:hypothetical protein